MIIEFKNSGNQMRKSEKRNDKSTLGKKVGGVLGGFIGELIKFAFKVAKFTVISIGKSSKAIYEANIDDRKEYREKKHQEQLMKYQVPINKGERKLKPKSTPVVVQSRQVLNVLRP